MGEWTRPTTLRHGHMHVHDASAAMKEQVRVLRNDGGQQPVAEPGPGVGLPLRDCVPSQFELFPLRGAADRREGSPDLPTYLTRDVDAELRAAVARAAAGSSVMVTLVSDLVAGKKRAAWECLWQSKDENGRLLMRDWAIWPAVSPSSAEALIEAARSARPRTVYFLPGLDRYFGGPDLAVGDTVARVLRETLNDPSRVPILVLATIRMGPLRDLKSACVKFPHAKLLVESSEIKVPDEFNPEEMARALSSEDPRVADSAILAEADRYVVQHMVDVHDLQTRFEKADILEETILKCAIKLRRFGNDVWLTRGLLEKCAGALLHDKVQHFAGDDRFDKAFAELERRGRGEASMIIKCDETVSRDDLATRYRLDSYLERRHVLDATDPVTVEPQLFPILVDEADTTSRVPLARECRKRGLLYWAMRFYLRASDDGDRSARLELADMLRQADRINDALEQYQPLIDGGDRDAITLSAEMLIAADRNLDAIDLLKGLTKNGNRKATVLTARAREHLKQRSEMLRLYRKLAEDGHAEEAAMVADMTVGAATDSERSKVIDDTVEWLMGLADKCGPKIVEHAIELLVDGKQVEVAMDRLERYARTGKNYAWLIGAEILFSHGRVEDALDWCREAVKCKASHASKFAANINAQLGFSEAAMRHALAAVEAGSPEALTKLGNVHAAKGLTKHALDCYENAAKAGDRQALARAAELAAMKGWSDRAFDYHRQAQRKNCAPPPSTIAVALCEAGQISDAFAWYFKTLPDVSNPDIIIPLSDVFLARENEASLCWDTVDLALSNYVKLVSMSRPQAISWLAEGILRAGEEEVHASANQYDGAIGANAVSSRKLLVAADLLNDAAIHGDPAARTKLVKLLFRLNRHAEAYRHLDTLRRTTKTNVDVDMAIALAGQGKSNEAIAELWSLLKKADFNAVTPVARSLMRYGHKEEAIDFLEKGVEHGDIESHISLGDHKRLQRRYVDALDLYLFALLHAHPEATARIDTLFAFNRDHHAQRDLQRYGITLAAQIADPWSVDADAPKSRQP